ncbi:MAG TPA: zf-HC2 domain-containing protein [Bacteroidota bacterium]|nr:zf-HC2 domain-containing protein [Bacteroidota bacterium]
MKKRQMRCPEILDHICEELDTKISSAKCREIKRHLSECPNCTAYLDSLKKTITLYKTYPGRKVPQKARKQLFAVLNLKD